MGGEVVQDHYLPVMRYVINAGGVRVTVGKAFTNAIPYKLNPQVHGLAYICHGRDEYRGR